LADYAKQKFGWTKLKFEEFITPVMKKVAESKSQKGIESYFKVHSVPKSIEATLSKRVQMAVQKLGGKGKGLEVSDDEAHTTEKTKRTKKSTITKGKKFKDESSELLPILETNEDEMKVQITQDSNEQLNNPNNKIKSRKFVSVNEDVIPQKEQDKANALKSKLRAIEIYRKSKKGLDRTRKVKKVVKKIKDEADLSESSSSS
jgi:DNA excision repair protein ERCC-5